VPGGSSLVYEPIAAPFAASAASRAAFASRAQCPRGGALWRRDAGAMDRVNGDRSAFYSNSTLFVAATRDDRDVSGITPSARVTLQGGAQSSARPDTVRDNRCRYEVHEGGCKLDDGQRMGFDDPGRHRSESQPSSCTGENPPYGMIGRVEETSASFEARPRLDPTRLPLADIRNASARLNEWARNARRDHLSARSDWACR
jgi:hypothetical protein